MALFLQVLLLIGGYHALQTGDLIPVLVSPLLVLTLWVPLRTITPRTGIPSPSIRHESPLLKFWTGWLVLFGIVASSSRAVFGDKHEPVTLIECILWVVLVAVFIGGTALVLRWWPPQRPGAPGSSNRTVP